MEKALFLLHVAVTLIVAGMMWFVQVIHYPLLRYVGKEAFRTYEAIHTRRAIAWVVSLMVAEAITGGLLLWWRPGWLTLTQVWVGLLLLGIVWASTMFLQVPQHHVLAVGFDERALDRLVSSNWIRTICYTGRTCLMLWIIARAL